MGAFTDAELTYLTTRRRLGRMATVGRDGAPHVVPVGWTYNAELGTVDIYGRDLVPTKKFRDVVRGSRVAIVIDDVLPPWRPRGVEVRGRAEAITEPDPVIRVFPERVVSWGELTADEDPRVA